MRFLTVMTLGRLGWDPGGLCGICFGSFNAFRFVCGRPGSLRLVSPGITKTCRSRASHPVHGRSETPESSAISGALAVAQGCARLSGSPHYEDRETRLDFC